MADEAREWTDEKLKEMEQKISDIYSESQSDITAKWEAYMKRGEARLSKLREKAEAEAKSGSGDTMAQKAYESAVRNYTLKNEDYKTMVDVTTDKLAHANEIALAYSNDQLPEVYTKNWAQVGSDLSNVNLSFMEDNGTSIKRIVNEDTIKRLIESGDVQTPFMKSPKYLNIPKDKRWNTKQINSSVLQGILQGESMKDIAKRIFPIVDRNSSAAIRNARTLVTGAENAGRNDSYKRLSDEGAVINKVWIATPDGRTRDWHLEMDGQEVPSDEYFIDGLGNELEYPGDPGGAPESVYNCRCSMKSHIIGFRRADGSISYVDYERTEKTLHEQQIEAEKGRRDTKPDISHKQNAYDYIGEIPNRPRQADYGGYTDEFLQAREEYKANREAVIERAEKWYSENANTNPMSIDELKEWCEKNNCAIYGSLDGLDMTTLSNYTARYEQLSKDFPFVEEYHKKLNMPFEIAYTPDRAYDAEASHGITFGSTYANLHDTFISNVTVSSGEFVKGENPLVRTFDHEYGHQVYDALKYGKDKDILDTTREEMQRRVDLQNDLIASVAQKDGMSEYATTNDHELFAEAFCAWYGGEKTEFAKSFGDFLARWT